jgi:chromosome segregation ATPase
VGVTTHYTEQREEINQMAELTYDELLGLAKKSRITLEAKITELEKELESANQKIANLEKKCSSFNYCDGFFRPINKNTEE